MKANATTKSEELRQKFAALQKPWGQPLSSFADLEHGARYRIKHPAFLAEKETLTFAETSLFAHRFASSSKWVLFEPRSHLAIAVSSDSKGRILRSGSTASYEDSDAFEIKPADLERQFLFYPVDHLLRVIEQGIRWEKGSSFPVEQLRDKASYYLDSDVGVNFCIRIGRRPRVIGKTIWALYQVSHPSVIWFVRSDRSVGGAYPCGNQGNSGHPDAIAHLHSALKTFMRTRSATSFESMLPSWLVDRVP